MRTLIHQPGNYINSSPSRPALTHPLAPLWEELTGNPGQQQGTDKGKELEEDGPLKCLPGFFLARVC